MVTLTGMSMRTITGHLVTLLEYPRWLIDRDIDFSACHLQGQYDAGDAACNACDFGKACRWLSIYRDKPTLDTPLDDLVAALRTAAGYVRTEHIDAAQHDRPCDCETCRWLRSANSFLRAHRHRT
jgi:hypothetical protein